jgi:putative transcriptional regulator
MSSLAGSFLVARPTLLDPNFRRTVVLMLSHDEGGALGVVVNRPAKVEGAPFPVFAGGPCPSQGLIMLHGHAEWLDDPSAEEEKQVCPGVFLGDNGSAERVAGEDREPSSRYRMIVGYAGWSPGQLEGELEAGAWVVTAASGELVFDTPPEELWERLAPPRLPEPSLN